MRLLKQIDMSETELNLVKIALNNEVVLRYFKALALDAAIQLSEATIARADPGIDPMLSFSLASAHLQGSIAVLEELADFASKPLHPETQVVDSPAA